MRCTVWLCLGLAGPVVKDKCHRVLTTKQTIVGKKRSSSSQLPVTAGLQVPQCPLLESFEPTKLIFAFLGLDPERPALDKDTRRSTENGELHTSRREDSQGAARGA